MRKKGFRLDLKINEQSWTGFYEDVEEMTIRRYIGANREIEVIETIKARGTSIA